jgi:mannose-6-phosphate isomerase-like protein (cupin superfamily)
MHYTLTEFADAPRVPYDLDGRILYTSEKFELIHLNLKPGEVVQPHAQPFDVIFFVQDGCGELVTGTETDPGGMTTLKPAAGSTITVHGHVQRSWRNPGGSDLRILVMKLIK